MIGEKKWSGDGYPRGYKKRRKQVSTSKEMKQPGMVVHIINLAQGKQRQAAVCECEFKQAIAQHIRWK